MAIHRVVSIEIGLDKTRICEVDYKKKNPHVYKCVVFDTPENTVEETIIRDKKVLADAINAELERADITCRNFVFTANSPKILSREVNIPKVKEVMLPSIIEGQKADYFPMDISEHELAYTILDENKEDNTFRVNLFAVPDTTVRNYFGLVEEIGGRLIALDYAGNSIYQWVKKTSSKEVAEVEMYVQMNAENTIVMIMDEGSLALSRNINIGAKTAVDALKEAQKNIKLSDDDAYNTLHLEKLIKERFNDANTERSNNMSDAAWLRMIELQDAVTESLRPLVININRVIEYYSSKNKEKRIPSIKFLGAGTRINGLSALITNEIGLPVTVLTELTDLTIYRGGAYDLEQTSDLIAPVGAAIETIKFLNVQFDSDKGTGSNLTGILILFVVALVASAIMIVLAYFNYVKALVERDRLAAEYDKKTYINQVEAEYNDKMNTLNEVIRADENTYTYNEEMNKLIAQLEEKLPKGTVVHSISSAGEVLILSVTVADKPTAAQLLMQLQQVPYLASVSTSAIAESVDAVTGQTTVTFTITCTYTRYVEEETTPVEGEVVAQ